MTAAGYLVNLGTLGVLFLTRVAGHVSVTSIVLAAVYLALFPLAAFFGWHRSLCLALRTDSALWYALYFAAFGLQLLVYGLLALGLASGGGGGLIATIDTIVNGRILAAVLCAACTALMTFNLLAGIYLVQAVGRVYWGRQKAPEAAAAGDPRVRNFIVNTLNKV